jgi:hypothetical protein
LTSYISLTIAEIFTHHLAEDIWQKSLSSQDLVEHQELANASASQEDLHISPCEDFKSIDCLVQELWCLKLGVANCDSAVNSSSSRT